MNNHWVVADGAPVRAEPMKGTVLTRLAKYAKVETLIETVRDLMKRVKALEGK